MFIFIIWLLLSCLCGWILNFFIYPPDAVWLMYYDYGFYIEEYDLFCLSMIMVFILMPFALFLSWKNIARNTKVIYAPSVSRLICLIMLIPIFAILFSGLLGLDFYEGSVFYLFARILIFFLDWIGGVIYNTFGLYLIFMFIVLVYKNHDKYKSENNQKNY